ncbi:MAG: NADH-quinone oxidoreductase subunit NuoK [Pirellulales bacterium]|nr:NADH-quinone oxidoreductase subunit NuoK [Pirellulales bacterium]
MHPETALLNNCLLVGAALFGLGAIGFLSRRNMIVMFLSVEIMLQGASLSLAAWGRFHNDFGGQTFVLFVIAVAASEAAVALALILTLYRRRCSLDVAAWHFLREADQPPFRDAPLPDEPAVGEPDPPLAPAGVRPRRPEEESQWRPEI